MIGPDDTQAVPFHDVNGGLLVFDDHGRACEAAKDLVRAGITRHGAFVAQLKITAFYLPVPLEHVRALGPVPDSEAKAAARAIEMLPTVAHPDETRVAAPESGRILHLVQPELVEAIRAEQETEEP